MKRPPLNPLLTRRGFLARSAAAALTVALGRLGTAGAQAATPRFSGAMELAVNFTLTPPTSGRAQRPYIAVWLENSSGQPVRTLSLWVNTSGRGQRYIRELRRWFQDTQGGGPLIDAVSSPTRMPGQYSVSWDGRDDRGAPVALGEYALCIEYAREHGPYDLIREKVTLGNAPFRKALPGNAEVGEVSVEYRTRA